MKKFLIYSVLVLSLQSTLVLYADSQQDTVDAQTDLQEVEIESSVAYKKPYNKTRFFAVACAAGAGYCFFKAWRTYKEPTTWSEYQYINKKLCLIVWDYESTRTSHKYIVLGTFFSALATIGSLKDVWERYTALHSKYANLQMQCDKVS